MSSRVKSEGRSSELETPMINKGINIVIILIILRLRISILESSLVNSSQWNFCVNGSDPKSLNLQNLVAFFSFIQYLSYKDCQSLTSPFFFLRKKKKV